MAGTDSDSGLRVGGARVSNAAFKFMHHRPLQRTLVALLMPGMRGRGLLKIRKLAPCWISSHPAMQPPNVTSRAPCPGCCGSAALLLQARRKGLRGPALGLPGFGGHTLALDPRTATPLKTLARLLTWSLAPSLLLEEAKPMAAHLKKELVMGASLGRIRHRSTSMAREYYAVFAAAFAFATDLAFPSASCCALTEGGTGITGWSLCVSAVGSV